jgi:hypothetical protein
MGRLIYAIDDVHTRVDLREFVPPGLSTRTARRRSSFNPGTSSQSQVRDDGTRPPRARAGVRGPQLVLGYEGWMRGRAGRRSA